MLCTATPDNSSSIENINSTARVSRLSFPFLWLWYQQGEINNGTKRRSRTLTGKGKEYQLKILFEKRKKLDARMARECKLIDDLMCSSSNVTTVKKETDQFHDQFKELVSLHKEYVGLLPQEVVSEEDETVHDVLFTQKHRIYNWIKETEAGSKSRSSRNSSKESSGGSSKKSSSSSKNKAIKKLPRKNINEGESTGRKTKNHSQKKSMLSFVVSQTKGKISNFWRNWGWQISCW